MSISTPERELGESLIRKLGNLKYEYRPGEQADRAKEIWLVDKAPVVIDNFKQAVTDLDKFMQSQGLAAKPDQVANLKGDAARARFINCFKEVQRLKTQLDQYTDLMAPLGLSWRERRDRELALMADLAPLLKRRAEGREISGLMAYE